MAWALTAFITDREGLLAMRRQSTGRTWRYGAALGLLVLGVILASFNPHRSELPPNESVSSTCAPKMRMRLAFPRVEGRSVFA
jgi:hypothetical protein